MGVRKKRDPLTKKGRRAAHRYRVGLQPRVGDDDEISFDEHTIAWTKKQQAIFDEGYSEGHTRGMQAGLVAGEQSAKAAAAKDLIRVKDEARIRLINAAGQAYNAISNALHDESLAGRVLGH